MARATFGFSCVARGLRVLQLLVKFCKAILDSKVIKGIEKGDLFVVRVSFDQRQGGKNFFTLFYKPF
ncbi:hypothetical protein [Campylobacter concisus]